MRHPYGPRETCLRTYPDTALHVSARHAFTSQCVSARACTCGPEGLHEHLCTRLVPHEHSGKQEARKLRERVLGVAARIVGVARSRCGGIFRVIGCGGRGGEQGVICPVFSCIHTLLQL